MCGQVSCASDSAGLVVGYHQQSSIIWSDVHIFLKPGVLHSVFCDGCVDDLFFFLRFGRFALGTVLTIA